MRNKIAQLIQGLPTSTQRKFKLFSISAPATGHATVNVKMRKNGFNLLKK